MASDKSEVVQYWNGGRGFGFIAPDVRTAAAARGPLLTQSGRTIEKLSGRIVNNQPRLYCILNNIIVDGQQIWHQIAYLVHQ